MKLAILSRNPKLYSTRRLVEAGEQRGHEVQVIDVLRCYMNFTSHRPSIHYKGASLDGFDAVIPRIGASVTFYGTAVLRQFEMMGVYPLNESVVITRSRDKLRSLQLLSRKGNGLPITGFAHNPDDIQDLIKMVDGVTEYESIPANTVVNPSILKKPATTGSSTAKAGKRPMGSSKLPTTAATRKAVSRFIFSHGGRLR